MKRLAVLLALVMTVGLVGVVIRYTVKDRDKKRDKGRDYNRRGI